MNDEANDWDALDQRLRAIEERLGAQSAPGPSGPGASDDTFWALDGLRHRLSGLEGGGVVFAGVVEGAGGVAEWQYGLPAETLIDQDQDGIEMAASRLAALGHATRIRLVVAVLRGTTTTASLAELEGIGTTGQVYHHVRALTAAGWLRSAGRGRVGVPTERVVPLLVALAAVV